MPAELCEGLMAGRSGHGKSDRGWGLGVILGPDMKNHVSHAEAYRHYAVVREGVENLYRGE